MEIHYYVHYCDQNVVSRLDLTQKYVGLLTDVHTHSIPISEYATGPAGLCISGRLLLSSIYYLHVVH